MTAGVALRWGPLDEALLGHPSPGVPGAALGLPDPAAPGPAPQPLPAGAVVPRSPPRTQPRRSRFRAAGTPPSPLPCRGRLWDARPAAASCPRELEGEAEVPPPALRGGRDRPRSRHRG